MPANAKVSTVARPSPQQKVRKQQWFPPQHGAWAFIGLPIALGIVVAPWTPLLALTSICAIAAFPLSHFLTAIIRYPNKARYVKPLILWAALSLPLALAVLIARPWLIWFGAFYLIALSLNIALARNKLERSLANDVIFIVECVALTPIMWAIGSGTGALAPTASNLSLAPASLWVTTLLAFLVLVDSTLHVKSLIRERNNPRYRTASRVWSIFSLIAAFLLAALAGWPAFVIAIPFGYLIARCYLLNGKDLKPGVLGIVELGAILLLFAAVIVSGG
ncbi:MAG: YwiC-like family protein [Candidatus Nanopelagicales bacterium]